MEKLFKTQRSQLLIEAALAMAVKSPQLLRGLATNSATGGNAQKS